MEITFEPARIIETEFCIDGYPIITLMGDLYCEEQGIYDQLIAMGHGWTQ